MARAANAAQVSKEEVLTLLRAATQSIPVDSTRAAPAGSGPSTKGRKPVPAWRPAGARGAAGTEVTAMVYWKR